MIIRPINGNVLIRPATEQTVFASTQTTYEERGEILALPADNMSIKVGQFVYFDSWCAARYKDSQGNEHWLVPFDKIKAIEVNE